MAVDIEGHLQDVSLQIDRLRVLYEQYFMGIEKGPPQVARRELEKKLDFLSRQNIGNTAVRFRYLGVLRRWKTYAERWDKILREIENGTYPRHRARVEKQRRAAAERERPKNLRPTDAAPLDPSLQPAGDGEPTGPEDGASTEQTGPLEGDSAATVTPSGTRIPRTPSEPGGASVPRPAIPGMSEPELRALHQRYVEARRASGEGRAEVRYETLVSTLQKQIPDILQRNRCREVAFDVVVREDGKVILKAQPKR